MYNHFAAAIFVICFVAFQSNIRAQENSAAKKLRESVRYTESIYNDVAFLARNEPFHAGQEIQVEPSTLFFITTHQKNSAPNCFWIKSELVGSTTTGNPADIDEYVMQHEMLAKIGDKTFVRHGSKSKDITDKMGKEEVANSIAYQHQLINRNPLALPFLGLDSIYFGRADFPSVTAILSNCEFQYSDKNDRITVWSNESAAWEFELSESKPQVPIRTNVYIRPVGDSVRKGGKLGELIYRTTTQWKKFEAKNGSGEKGDSKTLPVKVVMEHFPSKSKPEKKFRMLDIAIVWEMISEPDVLTPDTVMGKSEKDPIGKIYLRLEEALDDVVAAQERKNQGRNRKD